MGVRDQCQALTGLPSRKGFPSGSVVKNPPANARDSGLILGSGKCPGEGNGNPLQCSCLENSMDCIVHGDTKSWTQLSDLHFF